MHPPWKVLPAYNNFHIGWRMGYGESYLWRWAARIEKLPKPVVHTYFKTYPAPLTYGSTILHYLNLRPSQEKQDDDSGDDDSDNGGEYYCDAEDLQMLLNQGLVAHDIAYHYWLEQQHRINWPWQHWNTPQHMARHSPRSFWYFSRQLHDAKKTNDNLAIPTPPWRWRSMVKALHSGNPGKLNPRRGLTTLAKMLCAGRISPPWELGLSPASFRDSFKPNMGYSDAFRLWTMDAIDDEKTLLDLVGPVPQNWAAWWQRHVIP